uniref:ERCC1-like central domain-containing protein n=1 Tax=Parascaris univalens TaxID=6257 RepID=A0A915AFS8_PARUN
MEGSTSGQTTSASSKLAINRRRQEGNPVLKYIRNVPFEWADIKADFEAGKEMGILYLSLKWHKLHPGYIETRMNSDGADYIIKQIQRAVDLLCGIRSISTSDAQRLIGTFGSIAAIANADIERLSLCPGLGPVKAENIFTFFRIPFIKT